MFENETPEAIILAAGLSSRAGCFKMEINVGGKPLLARQIELFSQLCERIIVVGGYQIERIRRITDTYPNVVLAHNRNYEDGMFSSVQCGVRQAQDSFFLTPGDYPFLGLEVLQKILQHSGPVRIPVFKGRKGHPVFIESQLIEPLLQYKADSNLREFIGEQRVALVPVEDEAILFDIDTVDDYKNFVKMKNEGKYEKED